MMEINISHKPNPAQVLLHWDQGDVQGPEPGMQELRWWESCRSVTKLCPLLVTLWTAACQAPPSFTISWNLLKFRSTELVMWSNHLILGCPLLFWPSIFPSIRVFFPVTWLFTWESSWLKSQAGHTFSQWNREANGPQALNLLALAPFSPPSLSPHPFGVPTWIPIRLNAFMLLFCYMPTGYRMKPKLKGVSQSGASLSSSLLYLPVFSWQVISILATNTFITRIFTANIFLPDN